MTKKKGILIGVAVLLVAAGTVAFCCKDKIKQMIQPTEYTITQYSQANQAQGMCYTITDTEGHLIIIDGGFDMNSELVLNMIIDHDSYVDAWIITHPHQDHVSVFNNLVNGDFDFQIGTVYTIDLDYDYYESVVNDWDGGFEYYTAFLEALEQEDNVLNVQYVHNGDEYDLFGLDMKIFNAFELDNEYYLDDPANNGSMMFKLSGQEESILFCADVSYKLSDYLMETWGDELKADYLQVAHHGIGRTMPTEFNLFVDPKVAFIDLPDWMIFSNDIATERYNDLVDNGIEVLKFESSPNSITLK